MSLLDSQKENRKRSRETSDVFDSVFEILMGFADEAETIVPQPKRGAVDTDATDGVHADEEEPLESAGDGNAGEMFDQLHVRDKEKLLKYMFGEIVGNMLDKLPEDGKETFLVRCFDGLFPKLPSKTRRAIEINVKRVSSQSQEALATQSAPESSLDFPNDFPTEALEPVAYSVRYSNKIGRRGRGAGGGGRQ